MGHVQPGRAPGRPASLRVALAAAAAAILAAPAANAASSSWSKLFTVDARVFTPLGKGLRWTKWPPDSEIFASYPEQAYREHLHGSAIVECVTTAEGALKDCTIVEEAPEGKGFGAATLAVVSRFEFGPKERLTPELAGKKLRVPAAWQTRRVQMSREVWERSGG